MSTQVKTDVQKDLHVLITRDLKWRLEILAVSTKTIKMLGFIRRSCVNISMTTESLLHYTQFSLAIMQSFWVLFPTLVAVVRVTDPPVN